MNMHPKYARLVNRLPEHQKNKIFAFAMPKISRKSIFFVSMLICIVLLVSAGMFLLSPRGVVKGVYTDGYHYQYKDTKSNFDSVSFAKSEKLLPSYRIKEGDVSLAMTYSPTKVKDSYTVISGVWGSRDSLKFKDVEENTNIIYTLEGENTVKEDIELTKRPTKESISSYKFTIELTGLTYERNENGAIIPVFFDKQGSEYSIPPLVMQDANGKESNLVTLTLSAPDPNLPHIITAIVTPNAQWLTDTTRKYPVRIDPTVVRGDAPVAYWKFDEGTGTTAHDSAWRSTNTTTNYITNPSFEVDTSGWQNQAGSMTRNTSEYLIGSASVAVAAGSSNRIYITAAVNAGEYITMTAWAKTSTASAARIHNEFYGGDYSWQGTFSSYHTGGGGWERVQLRFPATGTATSNTTGYFFLYSDSGTSYFDGVQVEKNSVATQYCDGSLTGSGTYTWNGTAHASSSTCNLITDGTITGALWKTEDLCISGKCLAFDNVDDGVSVAGNNFTTLTDYTMCAWVNPKGNHKNYTGTIMSSGDWNVNHWAFGINQANTAIQTRRADGVNFPEWSYTFPLSRWTYVCLTRSGTSITAYANGVQVGSPSTGTTGFLVSNATNTTIGRETYAGGYFAFNGSIDEPKIYNYARTALQINADYNAKGSASAIGSSAVLGKSTANNDAFSNGLVGYWKLDESASPAVDNSGNGNSGTWVGTTAATSGKYGNGAVFDGDSDYIEMADTPSLSPGGAFTFSTWIYQTAACTGDCIIFNKESEYEWRVVNGSIDYAIANTSPGWTWVSTGMTISQNTWTLLTLTYDSTAQEIKAYKNGELTSTRPNSTGTLADSGQTLRLAARSGPGSFFGGRLDETRIYNRALSPKEVRDLYAWAPGPYTYLSFEEGTGNNINDTSGNGYSGAWNGTGTHWTNGKYGKAAKFNGSDDYISFSSLPKPSSLPVTIEFWAQPTTSTPVGMFDSAPNTTEVFRNYGGGGVEWWPSEPYITLGLTANQWTHLAFTFSFSSGTQYIEWYKNGIKQTTGSASGDGQWAWTTFRLGNINGGSAGWYSGDLDEFKIYNYARTAKQITEDMQAGQPVVSAGSGGGGVGQGAVGYWKFDEGYGTTANNSGSGGSAQNGTISGPTWSNSGRLNKAINFDGSNDEVVITQKLAGNEGTISGWVNIRSYPSSGFSPFFSQERLNNTAVNGLTFGPASNGKLSLSLAQEWSSWIWTSGDTTLSTNTWYYIAATWKNDGSTTPKVYVNGKLDGVGTPTSESIMTAADAHIGFEEESDHYFSGSIDELKIYSYPLSEDEIKLDYSDGSSLVLGSKVEDASDNPVGYWKLDEASGNTAANTGSGTGTATWSSTGTWVNGRINGAGNVNGQYLVHSTTGLSSTNGTVEAWVKPITGTDDYWGVWQTHDSSSVNWVDWIWLGRYGSTMYFRMGNGSDCCSNDTTFTSTGYFPSDQWTHVAATWRGDADSVADDTMTVYVNGVQMVQRTNVSLQATLDASARIGFGHTYAADGHMDEVKVYNYARSAEQIKADAATDTLNPSLPGAPVGEWKFEEGTGTSANDTSGNGITGTLNSSPSWAPGKIGKGLLFSGSNNVTLGAAKHDTLTNATFETWFNYTGGFDDNYVIVQRYKDSSNRQPVFVSYSGGYGNKLVFENIVGGSNRGITSDSTITANTWYHLAVTCGSGGMKMYLNGQVQASTNATTDCFSSIAATTETYIGQNFKGTLDQTKIYNYARTPAQIAYDYNRGKPVAYYRLNECTGSTVHSTNEIYNSNLNGTITIGGSGSQTSVGTCTTSSTAWGNGATGKVNGSLNFDGTDDQISISGIHAGGGDYSVSTWFKVNSLSSDVTIWSEGETYATFNDVGINSNGSARFTSFAGLYNSPSGLITTGTWYHMVATNKSGEGAKIYLNGRVVFSDSYYSTGATGNTMIGRGTNNSSPKYFPGQIDEVQIYNYALSSEQIKAVYSNGAVSFK